ncbi:methyl-accepting chemotaxis protein [Caldimonas brevitalea]|uniref:Methyl-accepting chemotaxis protein n=1 Tax=Caldimonas brevitalea TaxID=413882 RepID=A0A0G3BZB4_9BURK|nr:methyl-accepting chemotaxis protein [Caldimonas brevitalea]AKJ31845.1 methyl-accepting chemotaxis protein [Caldimonas brevitalea]
MNKTLANLPIGVKIAIAPLLVALCLLGVSLQSYLGNRATEGDLSQLTQDSMPRIQLAKGLIGEVAFVDGMVLKGVMYEETGQTPVQIKQVDEQVERSLTLITTNLGKLKQLVASDATALEQVQQSEKAFALYRKSVADIIDVRSAGVATAAAMTTIAEKHFRDLRQHLNALSEGSVAASVQQSTAVADRLHANTMGTLIATVAALLLSAGAIALCLRLILTPLSQAVAAAKRVASGDLVPHHLEVHADATGQVLAALNDVTEKLNGIVGGIRRASTEIESASTEIASGNQDLSDRTERTAASLQQTAAVIERLSTTVQGTAETSRLASRLAAEASDVASQGGSAVADVTTTMSAINEQSRRIADITAVIDGIAFQTNILALNAAVEAARAGEQGRGFAVVAQEVRSLAQRSATAAKEIKSLIASSSERVEEGTEKVQRAGATMERIVHSIRQLADLVAEISSATGEQAGSIEQVNQTVGAMEASTQQNAALVEEAAAATQALRRQAEGLVHAVSAFHIA